MIMSMLYVIEKPPSLKHIVIKIKFRSLLFTLSTLIILFFTPVPLWSEDDSKTQAFSGFLQTLYRVIQNNETSDPDQDGFSLAKVRPTLTGQVSPHISYVLQVDLTWLKKDELITDAQVCFSGLKPFSIIAGQMGTPVSPSFLMAAPRWETFLMPLAVEKLSPKRDIVVLVLGEFLEKKLNVAAGIFNGAGANTLNTDDRYLYAGRIYGKPVEYFELSGSLAYHEKHGIGEKRLVYDGYFEADYRDILLKSELAGRRAESIDTGETIHSFGFSILAAYTVREKVQPVIRYDWYNPDSDIDSDEITRITGGINYFVRDHFIKLMADYVHEMESGEDIENDQFLFMMQIVF